ncbi:MAG: PKD domain-containing protein [Anaerolineae bacterium]
MKNTNYTTKRINNRGQSLIEYGLILAFIAVVCISVITVLNDGIRYAFLAFVIQRHSEFSGGVAPVGGEFDDRLPEIDNENHAPIVNVLTDPNPPIVVSGQEITFTSLAFDPDDGDSIVSWKWDMYGDGNVIKTGPVVSHVYTTDQANKVWIPRLIVEDNHGLTAYQDISVGAYTTTPPNLPPVAVINVTPIRGSAPLTVTFTSTSYDPDGSVVTHQWDFGDNTVIEEETTEVHVYQNPGDYEAELTITDNGGRKAKSYRVFITVEEPPPPNIPPVVNIRANVANGFTGFPVDFFVDTATDSDGSVQYYTWDFGDGSAKVGPNLAANGIPDISHIYDDAGDYSASLTIIDNRGASATDTVPLAVVARSCNTAYIKRQIWNGITGTSTNHLTSIAAFPFSPDVTETLTSLEEPAGASGDNYGSRYLGYIVAPETGQYTFYIASDDSSDFYLSSNDSPSNLARIAYVSGWTPSKDWTRSDSQKSNLISLVGGQRYYFEVHHKEGSGGDNMAVGWILPNESFPPNVITSDYLCFDESLIPPEPTKAPTPTPAPTATPAPGECSYQAETAVLSRVDVGKNHGGYEGSGFADYPGGKGSDIYIEWNINVATAGNYNLGFRYALSGGNRPLELKVNGAVANSSLAFPATGQWSSWGTVYETVPLNAGPNTIRLSAVPSNGANLDCLIVDPQ